MSIKQFNMFYLVIGFISLIYILYCFIYVNKTIYIICINLKNDNTINLERYNITISTPTNSQIQTESNV